MNQYMCERADREVEVPMTEQEQRVWDAIENALWTAGDADIKAGLAWISDEQKKLIAAAAISAALGEGEKDGSERP